MKSSRLTISPACEGRVKPGATDPTFTLSFTRGKPIDSSPEYHAIILSEPILWGICIKRCESVEGIDGLWTGPCFSFHPDKIFGFALSKLSADNGIRCVKVPILTAKYPCIMV